MNTLILINAFNQATSSIALNVSNSASVKPYRPASAAVFSSASSSDDSDADDSHILSDTDHDDEIPEDEDNVDDAVEYDENDHGLDSEGEGEESMMQRYTDGESTDGSASQPLRTLKKLQAMLEETDYATATSANKNSSASTTTTISPSPNPPASNYNRSVNTASNAGQTMEHPERQAPLVAQPLEPEGQNYPNSQQHAQQSIHQSYPQQHNAQQKVERIASPRQDSDDDQSEENGQLWTSKDRSKYKKQRKLQRDRESQKQRQQYLDQQEHHIHSDDDSHGTDMTDDTDDGLGYTLPNLPVYFSDAESTDDAEDENTSPNEKRTIYQSPTQPPGINRPIDDSSTMTKQSNQPTSPTNPNQSGALQQYDPNFQRRPPQQQGQSPPYHYHNMPYQQPMSSHQGPQQQSPQGQHQYPYPQYPQPSQSQQVPLQQTPQTQHPQYAPPYMYNSENTYGPVNHPQQQYMQQIMQTQQQYQAWAASQPGYSMPYPPQHHYQSSMQQQQQPQTQEMSGNAHNGFVPQPFIPSPPQRSDTVDMRSMEQSDKFQQMNSSNDLLKAADPIANESPKSIAAVTSKSVGALLSFDAVQKIAFFSMWNCLLCYCAVSPRTLEMVQYNLQFKKIIRSVLTTFIAPLMTSLLVLDAKENDLNSLVSTFYTSATMGYFSAFMLEVIVTTIIRIGVFMIWEPSIFSLTPDVPLIILPWTLREQSYRPKRITLFAADFAATCIAAPIIEEFMKLKVVQLSTKLPRNYCWRKVPKNESNGKKKKKRRTKYVLDEIVRKPGEAAVTNINSYASHMLAASLGMKFCDTTRRVLMYTKRGDAHKTFYAFFRGAYPIHELCGSMTALELAKRDVLGLNMPLWRMLLPAVLIHGLANLKGMKPIFKWNSSTPWSEIQISPWYIQDSSTLSQTISKCLPKLMWCIIMGRVLGYILKNYYMIGRKAVKRTTTFAGKNASFSAEMHTSALLKKTKKDKKDK